jgi:hypothetical protein
MRSSGTSDKYQNNNLKTVIAFGKFLEPSVFYQSITKRDQVVSFLDTKIKNIQTDPDKRWWITTLNDWAALQLSISNYIYRLQYYVSIKEHIIGLSQSRNISCL